ncbi:MAG: hypothetical protein PHS37_08430, partial [Candidatus Omnitrophica bacterium]|nr:hypothetical protein [Candidatus Omnitrophota bacterium]
MTGGWDIFTDKLLLLASNIESGLTFLKFTERREKAFRRYYFKKIIAQARLAAFLGAILYALVGMLDPFVVPEVLTQVLFLRFVVVAPIIGMAFLLLLFIKRETWVQEVTFTAVFSASISVVLMTLWDTGIGSQIYYGGLICTTLYGYVGFGMRFGN